MRRARSARIGYPWNPDRGDGTFCNPILYADYSDPDVVRVGDDFYLTSSSFNCTPGLPILHSRDLVNWVIINYAVKNLPHPRYNKVQPGCGIWAPAIRYHAEKFWIVFPTPDEGIYVTTATDPAGQWSEPHLLTAGKGLIDPCPLWDDDGRAYLVHAYAGSRAGIRNKLRVRPMTLDATQLTGEGAIVSEIAEHLPALEGPKFHKRNGWYYISAASGGVATGWQIILRSRNVYGPYEEKVVLAQRGTPINGPHQGALVDTPSGEWWFVHYQDTGVYGRVVHLQPVRWEDDWPVIGVDQDANGVGCPVGNHPKPMVDGGNGAVMPQTSDEFDQPHLGLQWQWHSNHEKNWFSLSDRPGFLRLYPRYFPLSDFSQAGNLLLQKFPAREFTVDTELELPAGQAHVHAGLVVMGQEYAALDVTRDSQGYRASLITKTGPSGDYACRSVRLRLRVTIGDGGTCRFGVVRADGRFYILGPAFQASAGHWIGAKVGIYCTTSNASSSNGHAEFEFFRIRSHP
ncbi:MAG TPA: glycoside hydrolase 43 family protein [Verrucomicrobiae bacterium]|nr:glycoside hydrolase 43 family protein [Verrucomicrobiae bacterium]